MKGGGGRFGGGMRYGARPKGDDDDLEGPMSQEALAKVRQQLTSVWSTYPYFQYSEELSARRSSYNRCFLLVELVDIIVLGLLEIVWHGSLSAWVG